MKFYNEEYTTVDLSMKDFPKKRSSNGESTIKDHLMQHVQLCSFTVKGHSMTDLTMTNDLIGS